MTDRWIDLDGAANVRDLGGLRTADGQEVRRDRLIRSDNLQGLTDADVRRLVDDHDVRSVVDLRTGVEVRSEGPGPLTKEPDVEIKHLSLFPEKGHSTDVAVDDDAPVVLPWQERRDFVDDRPGSPPKGATGVYLGYLDERPDSILDALRTIAYSPGSTVVHCAAGKDRTGVVVAMALTEVGVEREQIVDDYALSAQRIEAIFDRLRSSRTYVGDVGDSDAQKHAPRAETMVRVLDGIDSEYGGVDAWLRRHGWTDEDAAALRTKLLDAA